MGYPCDDSGEVAERFKAAVLKTVEGQPSGGSNPSLSASHIKRGRMTPFYMTCRQADSSLKGENPDVQGRINAAERGMRESGLPLRQFPTQCAASLGILIC